MRGGKDGKERTPTLQLAFTISPEHLSRLSAEFSRNPRSAAADLTNESTSLPAGDPSSHVHLMTVGRARHLSTTACSSRGIRAALKRLGHIGMQFAPQPAISAAPEPRAAFVSNVFPRRISLNYERLTAMQAAYRAPTVATERPGMPAHDMTTPRGSANYTYACIPACTVLCTDLRNCLPPKHGAVYASRSPLGAGIHCRRASLHPHRAAKLLRRMPPTT